MRGHPVAHGVGFLSLGEVGLEVFPDDTVQRGVLGTPTSVGPGLGAGGPGRSGSRPADLPLAGMGLCGHRRPGMSRGTGWSVSTSRRAEGRGRRMDRGATDELVSPKVLAGSGGPIDAGRGRAWRRASGRGRRPGRWCGPPGCSLCWPGLYGHRKPLAPRGGSGCGSGFRGLILAPSALGASGPRRLWECQLLNRRFCQKSHRC